MKRSEARAGALVGALTVVAVVVRVVVARRSGIWRDEANVLFVVGMPTWTDLLAFLAHHESHPPLFYVLMRLWQRLAGASEAAALALPIVLGAALVPALYHVGSRTFGRPVGLLAAGLVAVSATLVDQGATVRPYSLLPLLALYSGYFLWRALTDGRRWSWALHVASSVAMLYTHHWSWLVIGTEWLVLLVWFAVQLTRREPSRWPRLATAGVSPLFTLALYAPWWPHFLWQIRVTGHPPASPPPAIEAASELLTATLGIGAAPLAWLVVVLAAFGVFGAWEDWPGQSGRRLAVAVFASVPVCAYAAAAVLSPTSGLLHPRCYVMLAPLLLLVISAGLVALTGSRRRFVLVAVAVALVWLGQADRARWSYGIIRSNARELARAVTLTSRPDDLVVICPDWYAPSFNYYFAGTNPQINYPALGREGPIPFDDLRERFRDPRAYRSVKAALTTAHREGRRVWLVIDRGSRRDEPPPSEEELPALAYFWTLGNMRARQLYAELVGLYGRPVHVEAPLAHSPSTEHLIACLFERPANR